MFLEREGKKRKDVGFRSSPEGTAADDVREDREGDESERNPGLRKEMNERGEGGSDSRGICE